MKKLLAILSSVCILAAALYCVMPALAVQQSAPVKFVQSFEDESLALSAGNFTFSAEQVRTGSKSLKLVKDGSSATDNSFAAVFMNEADKLMTGTAYNVYFYIKPVTVAGAIEFSFFRNAEVNSHKGNSSGDRIAKMNLTMSQINAAPADENGWHKIVISSEFYVDEAKPYMNLWNCQWDGAAAFYIDDITFEPIVAPEIEENLLEADKENWTLGKEWSKTGFDGNTLNVTGGSGVATFIGKKVAEETIRVKLSSAVTSDWAAIAFRNQADIDTIKADGQKAYFYDIGNSYAVQWTKDGKLSVKLVYKEGDSSKWKNLAAPVDFNMSDGRDHTLEIKTTDDTQNNTTAVEVYVDGILRLSATDTEGAVKPAGYVQIVASSKDDSVTVKGFEIVGEKVSDYIDTTPQFEPKTEVSENLLKADSQNWIFGTEWSKTAVKDGVLTVTGGTGIATFVGKKVNTQSIIAKMSVKLDKEWAAISFRNQAGITDIEKSGQNAYFMTAGNSYALVFTKTGVSVKVAYAKDKWENIGKAYDIDLSDGREHLYQIVTEDYAELNATNIKVYIDGILCIDCTDTKYAVKNAGYVSFVCSNKADSITVTGFEIDGERLMSYQQGAPSVTGSNLVKNTNGWFFNKGWGYEGYTGTTGFSDGKVIASGDYGTALYKAQKIGQNYAELKFTASLSDKGIVFIGLRNSVTAEALEKNGKSASTMSAEAGAYVVRITKGGIALGIKGTDGNFKTLGTMYNFVPGFDINAQENTLVTRITDDTGTKTSRIEIWLNGERVMVYIDSEYAVKTDGYYSITVSDGKNNSDKITVTSFKIGQASSSPLTGDTFNMSLALVLILSCAAIMLISWHAYRRYSL